MIWELGGRALHFGDQVQIMGVLNATPDSFYDGGRYCEPQVAVERGLAMVEEGAAIVDIGGESSRPPMYGGRRGGFGRRGVRPGSPGRRGASPPERCAHLGRHG